tara:strand:- start:30716 stop:32023 length:1308 start_codon:yes stop_codon:yes gene_type:complete
LPIGVATIYKPFFIIFLFFIFLISCSPVDSLIKKTEVYNKENNSEENINNKKEQQNTADVLNQDKKTIQHSESILNKNVTIIFSNSDKENVVNQFINVIEMAVYNKQLKGINFNIAMYSNKNELDEIIKNSNNLGKIYIGPINAEDTLVVKNYCNEGAIFFSFASKKSLAKDCVYLVNFFPENELRSIFKYLPTNSKVAFLYPQNKYGYKINSIIDEIANYSDSIIVNRSSYKDDMSNVRGAIKELGKYELRKYELDRQKQILANKKDSESIKRLKKLKKFKTTRDFDFTHLILPDYGLRLLQVAPLLPYYDIDPNIVRFVGTGVWDDEAFFLEPSLQKSIFPGVEKKKRETIQGEFEKIYNNKFLRISTLPYDLLGILSYAFQNKNSLSEFYNLLNNSEIRFEGVDGSFYFKKNIIERDLDILQISNGIAKKIN